MPKDNPNTGAIKPSKATTEAAAVTRPIQESGSRAKGYEGVVKEQLRYVYSTGENKVRKLPVYLNLLVIVSILYRKLEMKKWLGLIPHQRMLIGMEYGIPLNLTVNQV